jgi:vancomycin permeability regulator SanA
MSDKDKIIEKVYFDPAGFGSINSILKDAKVYDTNITYDDVKQ